MSVALLLSLVGIVLLGVLVSKNGVKTLFQRVSVYWFRFALSFFVLFLWNVLMGFVGVFIPINLASAITLTILGLPGMVVITGLAIFL